MKTYKKYLLTEFYKPDFFKKSISKKQEKDLRKRFINAKTENEFNKLENQFNKLENELYGKIDYSNRDSMNQRSKKIKELSDWIYYLKIYKQNNPNMNRGFGSRYNQNDFKGIPYFTK
jgi:DNA mismatch repair ATPase MutS